MGNYISRIFPFLGARFIAVNDELDDAYPYPPERTPEKDIVEILLADLRTQVITAVELNCVWEEKREIKQRDAAVMRRTISALKRNLERQNQQIQVLYERA